MFDVAKAPLPVQRLVDWLDKQGFTIVSEQFSGVFNQFAEFRSEARRVVLRADRGEWDITLGLVTLKDDHLSDVWEAFLDDVELGDKLSDLSHQVEFIVTRWSSAIEKVTIWPNAEDRIRLVEEDYVQRRFGFSPQSFDSPDR